MPPFSVPSVCFLWGQWGLLDALIMPIQSVSPWHEQPLILLFILSTFVRSERGLGEDPQHSDSGSLILIGFEQQVSASPK